MAKKYEKVEIGGSQSSRFTGHILKKYSSLERDDLRRQKSRGKKKKTSFIFTLVHNLPPPPLSPSYKRLSV